MADDAHDDLTGLRVGEIEHAIITGADSPTVSIAEFLAAVRKRIVLQSQNCPGNAALNVRRQSRKFFSSGPRNLDFSNLRHQPLSLDLQVLQRLTERLAGFATARFQGQCVSQVFGKFRIRQHSFQHCFTLTAFQRFESGHKNFRCRLCAAHWDKVSSISREIQAEYRRLIAKKREPQLTQTRTETPKLGSNGWFFRSID
jgi:hypothetical protein